MSDTVNKLDPKTVNYGSWPRDGILRVVLISDTHMQHRKLVMPKGDMLIHAGDFTNKGRAKDIKDFDDWLGEMDYKHKIVVFGNHDTETDALAIRKDGRGNICRYKKKNNFIFTTNAVETTLENAKVLKNETIIIEVVLMVLS